MEKDVLDESINLFSKLKLNFILNSIKEPNEKEIEDFSNIFK